MTWEMIVVIALLVYALVNFVWEKIPTDVTSFTTLAMLFAAAMFSGSPNLPSVDALLRVFSNPAPITIAAMFVLSHALEKCGAIDGLALLLGKLAGLGYRRFLFVMILAVALVSAFVNNTPVVVILLPVVLSLAKKMDVPASKLLIPLSYASIFGGVCTAIGTSTNILVSGILVDSGMPALSMFEIASVGLPILGMSTLYLVIFGKHLLPKRETLTSILSEEERKEYMTEAFVQPGSAMVGKLVSESGLTTTSGVRLLEVIRYGVAIAGSLKIITLQAGDRLVLSCRPSGIAKARRLEGMDFIHERGLDLEQIASHEGAIVEAVIGPRSSIAGKTTVEINFRQRYRMVLMAIHRHGRNLREKVHTVPLEFGDTLLLMGSNEAIENIRRSEDMFLLDAPPVSAKDYSRKMPLVLGALLGVVCLVTFFGMPIVAATLVALALLLGTGCISAKDAYDSIEWRILMLIYGMLGLGMAMESSGLTDLFTTAVFEVSSVFSVAHQPWVVLVLLVVFCSFFTEILSNNATAVLMAPIAIALGLKLGVDPRPFVIAVCVASSASFATPIGYQTNTYVYSAGGYKFRDFMRVGIPLNLLYCTVCVIMVPIVWPF